MDKKPDPPPETKPTPTPAAPAVPTSNPALDEMRRKTPADNIEEALNNGR